MCSICSQPIYRSHLCKHHWTRDGYHCTWKHCIAPVFSLTLCRAHYRAANVPCAHEGCRKPSFCRQVCATHYRRGEFVPIRSCSLCSRDLYMNDFCFYHFTCRQCLQCEAPVFSNGLCQKHYMRVWRQRSSANSGATTSTDTKADAEITNPEKTCHIPETQSS